MWLPSVIASTPAANSSSAIFGVIPSAAGDVLAVDDDERRRVALAQLWQALQQRAPADAADDVADEQDARRRLTPALARGAVSAADFPDWRRLGLSHTLAMVGGS